MCATPRQTRGSGPHCSRLQSHIRAFDRGARQIGDYNRERAEGAKRSFIQRVTTHMRNAPVSARPRHRSEPDHAWKAQLKMKASVHGMIIRACNTERVKGIAHQAARRSETRRRRSRERTGLVRTARSGRSSRSISGQVCTLRTPRAFPADLTDWSRHPETRVAENTTWRARAGFEISSPNGEILLCAVASDLQAAQQVSNLAAHPYTPV